MLPSVRTLETAFPGKGKELRKVLEMGRSQLEEHPVGAARIAECYNPPKTYDIRLCVLDFVAETHGVEYLAGNNDTNTEATGYDYLNTGDPYVPTIVRSTRTGRYRVLCWGDLQDLA